MAERFDVLITAEQAWPAFERAVLAARDEIIAGFRIFDMTTRLVSPEAQAIGETWFDLLEHVVRRGVRLHIIVSDFDPVMATALHETAWRSVRQGAALAEVCGVGRARIRIEAALHPAKPGLVPWLAFLAPVLMRKRKALARTPERQRHAVHLTSGELPDMHPVTHHQKLAVIDGHVLYVGGLDLNQRRWDTLDHDQPGAQTWSDVQVLMTGPEAGEARAHLLSFTQACAGTSKPSVARHIKRTLSAPRRFQFPFLSPRCVLSEIEEAHLAAFREARHHLHIETQYMRSKVISDALAEAAQRTPDLTMTLIIPALPEEVAYEGADGLDAQFGMARQQSALSTLRESFGERLTVACPVRPVLAARTGIATLAGSPVIHVHNKVLIVDAQKLLIGSANLNGRSMHWDTEVAVQSCDPSHVARGRAALLQHWWFTQPPKEGTDPETMQAWWMKKVNENKVMRPEARHGFLVPFDADNHADMAQPLPGVTEDMV
ncbi:phospholipase D family protein [Primorskyibacter sp. S187A]|uniref:phospholipase D family protein n=1 Tax=Primorskyibacter sp. S187A TaxID=3415130 RepID=UPI003C7C2197